MNTPSEPPLRLGDRFRLIRIETFGADRVDEFARQLGLVAQVWKNYEEVGELAPAAVLRAFIELTGVSPLWLLRGEGPKYRRGLEPDGASRSANDESGAG